jgi:hypothetical protein
MVAMYLSTTIVAAGSCGDYALANHRQRMGTENSADIAILSRLPRALRLRERKVKRLEEPGLLCSSYA